MPELLLGWVDIFINGSGIGTGLVPGSAFRGDLFVAGGNCISRYGLILDGRTLQGVAGATVTLVQRSTVSEADGWYQVDLGCPSTNPTGGTTFITVSHPKYNAGGGVVGRGVFGVVRYDIALELR